MSRTVLRSALRTRNSCASSSRIRIHIIYIYIYIYYIPQVVTLKAHLLQASRAVHRRPLSAAGAKSLSAWACRTDRLWYEPKSWRVTPTPNPEKVVIFVYAYCIPHLSLIYVLLVTCVGLHWAFRTMFPNFVRWARCRALRVKTTRNVRCRPYPLSWHAFASVAIVGSCAVFRSLALPPRRPRASAPSRWLHPTYLLA